VNAIAPPWRVEQIGRATLILGDSRAIAPTIDGPAAIVSDPPYGQGYGSALRRFSRWNDAHKPCEVSERPAIIGDDQPFHPAPWLEAAPIVLLWGAHKFSPSLPEGTWLVWDKVPTGKVRTQGDGEAAWLNRPGPMRIFRHLWDGICVSDRDDLAEGRLHPMQKPVEVMRWSIQQAKVPEGGVILDPFMGSGSTGVAAVQAGHPFVGIEMQSEYFETACRRLAEAQRQGNLFGGL
jgi:site-specific DNA-methyltransferase (adenine-specific)/modification methylase